MSQKAFQAYRDGGTVTASSARKAAAEFFKRFPSKRKCNVMEGSIDGQFFTVFYGRTSEGDWPQSYRDVTKKTMIELPDVDFPQT